MIKLGKIPSGMSLNEAERYLDIFLHLHPEGVRADGTLDLSLDGDTVECSADLKEPKFQRIRRITGYLVGDLSRFNNAKASEVNDRVKHGLR